jgi:transposase
MARLALVREQISSIEKTRAERLGHRIQRRMRWCGCSPAHRYRYQDGGHAGAGDPIAESSRSENARHAAVTRSPDESGLERRQKGLAKAGNARVRRGRSSWRGASYSSRKTVRRRGSMGLEENLERR